MANKALLKFFLPLLLLCSDNSNGYGVRSDVTFHFTNNCEDPLWRASNPSIGDLDARLGAKVYEIFFMDDHYSGSIWVRTKCSTNASNYFSCETGDCGNGIEECANLNPTYPVTLLNFVVNESIVSYDVSLVHGQNVLVQIAPNGGTLVDGSGPCPVVQCNHDLIDVCPESLISFNKDGYLGCNSACDVLKDPKYCCDGNGCQPDEYSQMFKDQCPTARTYPGDNKPPAYQCKGAESYDITFCPST